MQIRGFYLSRLDLYMEVITIGNLRVSIIEAPAEIIGLRMDILPNTRVIRALVMRISILKMETTRGEASLSAVSRLM